MGLIRGALAVLASTVFFFAVLSSAIFFTIGNSLDYETVEEKVIDFSGQLMGGINLLQEIDNHLDDAEDFCRTSTQDYKLSYQNYSFRFSCNDLNKSVSEILNKTVKNFVADSYYEEYNCKFWDCFEKYPITFLVSEKSQAYWYKLLYFALTAVLISAIALFFLIHKKSHLPFLAGALIILASLVVLGISKLLAALSSDILSEIIGVFFSKSAFVFIRMMIIAGIVLFVGLFIEFYRVGFKVYNLFSKMEAAAKVDKLSKEKTKDKK